MKKFARNSAIAAIVAGAVYATAAMAFPAAPSGSQTIIAYYSNASYTDMVGAKVVVSNCEPGQVGMLPSWGTVTAYKRVQYSACVD